jgi:hypothetical protein
MQEDHDFANDLLIGPARRDLSGTYRTNPLDLPKPLRCLLDDVEYGGTEGADMDEARLVVSLLKC